MAEDPDDAAELDAYQAAWSVTAALEADALALATEISLAFDQDRLERGLSLVIARLLQDLRHHQHDCDCGSLPWVREQALHARDPFGDGP